MKYFSTHRKKLSITRFVLLQTRQIRTQHCRGVGVDRKVGESFLAASGDKHFGGPESGGNLCKWVGKLSNFWLPC